MIKRREAAQFPTGVVATVGVGIATLYGFALADRPASPLHFDIPGFVAHIVSDVGAQVNAVTDLASAAISEAAPVHVTVAVETSDKLTDLFVRVGYALDDVRMNGAVPRLFLANLPDDLPELRVPAERKALFIKATLPLILYANESIARDRRRVVRLMAEVEGGLGLAPADAIWVEELARSYRLDAFDFDELLARLDIVPPSLAIAQAAAESGWGTSRFARLGNALFGQKTFGDEAGLVPLRSDSRDPYKIRAFDDLVDAVKSYAFNLNSHPAYAEFRARRALLRQAGISPAGSMLAGALHRYSERGVDYVRFVETLIHTNGLEAYDDARLGAVSEFVVAELGESERSVSLILSGRETAR